jgi:hypothetical protein
MLKTVNLRRIGEDIGLVLVNHKVHLIIPLILEIFEVLVLSKVLLSIMELQNLTGINLFLQHLTRIQESLGTFIIFVICSFRLRTLISNFSEIFLILSKIELY